MQINEVLTGEPNVALMKSARMHQMRLALGGLFAMVMTLCVRFVPVEWTGQRLPVRFGFAPPSLIVPSPVLLDGIEWQVEALEQLVEGIQAETASLRGALRLMRVSGGILPAFATATPISLDEVRPASGIEPKPAPVGAISDPGKVSADLYAPAADLPRARSLFYGAQLGIFASRRQALAEWETVAHAPQLAGVSPRYLEDDAGAIRILAGPVMRDKAEAICSGVRMQAPACVVTPFSAASP